ncbi:MAG: S9 family peptidase [Bacteroidales bacterium]|nr:S9 family peptidase [Bacteroidales bacterium]
MQKIILFTTMSIISFSSIYAQNMAINYPETTKGNVTDSYFETVVADPYRWLEDDNSVETAGWVAAQNNITNAYLNEIDFRPALKSRLEKIWNYPKLGVPFKKGDNYFFFKNDGMQNQSVLYMRKSLDAEPVMLLDPNNLSADGTIALGGMSVSKDAKYLGYSISRGGSDWNEICVMEIESRTMLKDSVHWVKFSGISWFKNGFFYSAYDAPAEGQALSGSNQFHKVFYHSLGTNQSEDKLIFEDKENPLRNFYAYLTEDEEYLMVSESESTSGNALYVKKTSEMDKPFQKIAAGFEFEYNVVDHLNDEFLIVTTDHAPLKKLVLVDPQNPSGENWKTILAETDKVLESVSLVGDRIYAEYLADANTKASFFDYQGNLIQELHLPTLGTVAGFSGEKGENVAFYGFTSFTFPTTIYKYDLSTNKSTVYSASGVDFNPENFVTEQLFYTSKDGVEIPMFLVYKKGLVRDGNNPLLLYGYGGFNVSLTPAFSISRIPFIEQGGIYVSVNLRGGGEYGEAWHQSGTKLKKQNVFDDFISAAEYLIKEKYTNPKKLAIIGGSNGGLLVGACMTQRPDLFKVAIPIVGVMDMLRYQNFTIGWAWAGDYGRSDDNKEMFQYLYGYSPLHNIKPGINYPATMAITADHDDRVVPAHTFKFMAELQSKHQGNNPVIVRIETKAGHGAGKPTAKVIEENTDMYSFIMFNLGMKPTF